MANPERSEDTPTKISSDSGYSNSYTNSQSQRSGSSKSRHSGSISSGSSGYGGKASSLNNSNEATLLPLPKQKEHKKKLSKSINNSSTSPESSVNCDGTRSSSGSQECVTSEEENKAPSSPSVATSSQQQNGEDDKGINVLLPTDYLIQTPTHNTNENQVAINGEEDINNTPTTSLTLKAGDTPSVPGSQAGKNTDEENTCFSPSKLTNDSYHFNKSISSVPKYRCSTPTTGFSCVVSMRDGVVLYMNSSINTCLGYPKDMWLGRSFIDFLHPKDRNTFASHITSGVAWPLTKSTAIAKDGGELHTPLFCRVRRYRGLQTGAGNPGFGVRDREISYTPFRIDFSFRDVGDKTEDSGVYLIIAATQVITPYGEGKSFNDVFTTRHTSTGIINHICPEAVEYLGFLPQDIIGQSIFNFYHPDDMYYLKEVYETIIKKETTFKSKPYRFFVQNGDYITIETEWSTFVNPWSRKLEFVIGHHQVVQGPNNPDVFHSDMKRNIIIKSSLEEIKLKQFQKYQDEILKQLNEVFMKTFESEKQVIKKKCKDLTIFMDGIQEGGGQEKSDDELRIEIAKEKSLSERDSVMLGEISPHHDYYDSKSSTETPPSYNQLNYIENLQRFFESHPWTSYKSVDSKSPSRTENEQSSESYIDDCYRYCSSPALKSDSDESRNSSGSRKKCMSRTQSRNTNYTRSKRQYTPTYDNDMSNDHKHTYLTQDLLNKHNKNSSKKRNYTSRNETNGVEYKPNHLTRSHLNKHNSMIEKQLAKKHKETRSFLKAEEREKCERREKKTDFYSKHSSNFIIPESHGLKRPGSSWEPEENPQKMRKHYHPSHPQAHAQVHPQMHSQINSQIHSQIHPQINSQINSQIHPQINSQIHPQIQSQIHPQIQSQINSQIHPQIQSQIHPQIQSQINSQIHPQIQSQIHPQIQSQIHHQVHAQVHPQIHHHTPQPTTSSNSSRLPSAASSSQMNNDISNIANRSMTGARPVSMPTAYIPSGPIQPPCINPGQMPANMICQGSLWSPFSVNPMTPGTTTTSQTNSQNNSAPYPGLYPAVYLIPAQQGSVTPKDTTATPPNSNGYPMQYMMCPQPIFSSQPIVYPHVAMAYPPMVMSSNAHPSYSQQNVAGPNKPLDLPFDNYVQACQSAVSKNLGRPMVSSVHDSHGVSGIASSRLNANIGTTLRSDIADSQKSSKSNRGGHSASKSSKRAIRPSSRHNSIGNVRSRKSDNMDGEGSSYSSFYSSFLKTEASNSIENADSGGDESLSKHAPAERMDFLSTNSNTTDSKASNYAAALDDVNDDTWLKTPLDNSVLSNISLDQIPKLPDGLDYSESKEQPIRLMRKAQSSWIESIRVTPELINRYQLKTKSINDVLQADESALDKIDQPSLVNEQLSQLYIEFQLEGLSTKLKLEEATTSSSSEEEHSNENKKRREHSNLVMIYEEEAPLPSPKENNI